MTLIHAANMTADLFRVSYEIVDAANQQSVPVTVAEKIGQAMKKHVALADTIATTVEYTLGWPFSQLAIAPFRLVALANSLYVYQTDPLADLPTTLKNSFPHLLNLARLGFTFLKNQETHPYRQNLFAIAATVCVVADCAFRILTIALKRMDIAERAKELYQNLSFSSLYNWAILSGNHLLRTVFEGCVTFCFAYHVESFIELVTQFDTNPLFEQSTSLALLAAITILFKIAIHQLLNRLDIVPKKLREFEEWSISIVCSAALLSSASVLWGGVDSIPEYLRLTLRLSLVASQVLLLFAKILQSGIKTSLLNDPPTWSDLSKQTTALALIYPISRFLLFL